MEDRVARIKKRVAELTGGLYEPEKKKLQELSEDLSGNYQGGRLQPLLRTPSSKSPKVHTDSKFLIDTTEDNIEEANGTEDFGDSKSVDEIFKENRGSKVSIMLI